jgi:protein-S-isoprenylcysteine O-methyltransferase Ste14
MNWFIGITALSGYIWTILIRTPMEEKMMIKRFGEEYIHYMKKTGKYIPKLNKRNF